MNGELQPYEPTTEVAVHTDLDFAVSEATRQLAQDGIPPNTRIAYAKQWRAYAEWCLDVGRVALPATAQTLAEYTQVLGTAGRSPSTVSQAISAIRAVHRTSGHDGHPDMKAALLVLKGHRNNWAEDGHRVKKATPVLMDALQRMVATCDTSTLVGVRDRAVLVLGWAMMGRRSEVAALMDQDVRENPNGLDVYVAKSKTDKRATGQHVAVPSGQNVDTDPVRTIRAWRDLRVVHGVDPGGRLWRSIDRYGNLRDTMGAATVGRIVMRAVNAAQFPDADLYSAHGLRAGAATAAYLAGVPVSEIAKHGRWAENSPVVLGYIRAVDQWKDNPMRKVGL